MRRTFTLVLALLLCVNLIYSQNQRIVCDETCKIEAGYDTAQSKSGGNYAVVSPVGRSSVKMIQQAPRLETLEGKTIAVVGESFMTHVTHPEIKRLILKNYPTAKVILLDEIGEAGPFPAPGVTRKRKEEFEAKLKSMHVDAVIAGNGGCGLCTPKETGSCLTAEYIGIPSVIIAGPGFADQAYYTAYNNGVPVMRVAVYPGAFATHTNEELIRNTREVLWPQIVEALTKPITQEKQDRMGTFGYPISWCLVEDDAACQRVGWNPYHVQQGFNMNDNTVTASSTLLWGNNMAPSTTNPQKVMELIAWDITERCQFALGSGRQFTNRTILMTEPVAATLAKKYKSTDALDKTLVSVARRPSKERAFANYYANPGSEKDGGEHTLREYSAHIKKAEHAAMTDTPP